MLSRKVFDLFSYNANATLIGRVQFENPGVDELRPIELLCQGENGTGLTGAGRTVEQHMREIGGLEGTLENCDGVVLGRNL